MNQDNTLKPCPFCGGQAAVVDTTAYMDKAVVVRCGGCSTATKRILVDHPMMNANGLDESTRYTRDQAAEVAAKIWNRRVSK